MDYLHRWQLPVAVKVFPELHAPRRTVIPTDDQSPITIPPHIYVAQSKVFSDHVIPLFNRLLLTSACFCLKCRKGTSSSWFSVGQARSTKLEAVLYWHWLQKTLGWKVLFVLCWEANLSFLPECSFVSSPREQYSLYCSPEFWNMLYIFFLSVQSMNKK